MTRPARAFAVVAAFVCLLAGLVIPGRPAGAAGPVSIDVGVRRAVAYARDHGVRASVAVLDERTGVLYSAGGAERFYGSASVMKVFVAARLLAAGRPARPVASDIRAMLTRSDDAALERLLPLVGGTSVVRWVAARYHLSGLGAPARRPGCWGSTQISARGVVRLYRALHRDRRVGPPLLRALAHHTRRAADGTNQAFGIAGALRSGTAAVKQGWGACSSNSGGSVVNSTGLIARGRFAVAVLTDMPDGAVDVRAFNRYQARVVTRMARILLPGGSVLLPAHSPRGRVDRVEMSPTGVVRLGGWATDPDWVHRPLRVVVTRDGRTVGRSLTSASGFRHRYVVVVRGPYPGASVYCVRARNIGRFAPDRTLGCVRRTLAVPTPAPSPPPTDPIPTTDPIPPTDPVPPTDPIPTTDP